MPVKAPALNPMTARSDISTKELLQSAKVSSVDPGSKHLQPIHHEQLGSQKPTIELVARSLDVPGLPKQCKHSFTIFTDSQGRKTIITGYPKYRLTFSGNIEVIDAPYIEDNMRLLGSDWGENGNYYQQSMDKDKNNFQIISTVTLNNDQELQSQLFKAREVVKHIRTGNQGAGFDYDLCGLDACLGGNSNTLQRYIHDMMGYKIEVPKDIQLPGIDGKFYDGPTDHLFRKIGEQMQDQP